MKVCWFNFLIYFCYIEYLIRTVTDHNRVTQSSEVLGVSSLSSAKMNLVSVEEFANFSRYQKSTTVTAFTMSDKICLVIASNKWAIDSGAINHLTSNPIYFQAFNHQKHHLPLL